MRLFAARQNSWNEIFQSWLSGLLLKFLHAHPPSSILHPLAVWAFRRLVTPAVGWLQSGDNLDFRVENRFKLLIIANLSRLKIVQKKSKKMLTGDMTFEILTLHTVMQNNNNTQKNMKKTLLIAAAALVAGVVSSNAQVYSANIVGYVNQTLPSGSLQLVCNPLDDGTNTGNDVFASLPNKSQVQLWNGTGFTAYTKTSSGFTQGSTLSNPSLAVGTGFFVKANANYTNTYVGNVVPAPGGNSVTNSFSSGVLTLVGSPLPLSGTFQDVGTNSLNLYATLPNKSQVQFWNGSGFTAYTKTSSGFTQGSTLNNPSYAVGQGFFVKGNAAFSWVQTLQ